MVWDIISVVMSRGLGDWDSIVGLLFVSLVSVHVHVHGFQLQPFVPFELRENPNFGYFFGAREREELALSPAPLFPFSFCVCSTLVYEKQQTIAPINSLYI